MSSVSNLSEKGREIRGAEGKKSVGGAETFSVTTLRPSQAILSSFLKKNSIDLKYSGAVSGD